jgi:hypothetical protein
MPGLVEDFIPVPVVVSTPVLAVDSIPALEEVCTPDQTVASMQVQVVACTQAPKIGRIEATYHLGPRSLVTLRDTGCKT